MGDTRAKSELKSEAEPWSQVEQVGKEEPEDWKGPVETKEPGGWRKVQKVLGGKPSSDRTGRERVILGVGT